MVRSRFAQTSNRERRRVGVPIPTFATATVPATEEPQWNVETLVEAEGAISTFCSTRKRATLDLVEFTRLTKALQLPAATTNNDLSRSEALLLDLLVCASPTLYKLVKLNLKKQDDRKTWCLQVVEFNGNRIQELRSLAAVSQVSVEKRISMLAQIKLCKQQQTTLCDNAVAPKKISYSIDKLFPAVQKQLQSTLHERVAARAQAKLELQREVSDQAVLGDPALRLRLADALWSHSRHIQLRQSRLQSLSPKRTKQTTTPRLCVMTMKDVVKLLQGYYGTSRKEVVQTMLELQQVAPQWIKFDGTVVTKQTTVWIHPVDYQEIRRILGGAATETLSASTSLKRKSASTGRSLSQDLNSADRPNIDASPPLTPPRDMDHTRPSAMTGTKSSPSLSIGVATKKVKMINSASEVDDRKRCTRSPSPKEEDEIEIPARKKMKVGDSLRINHHLILTDADYDGGEVITPSYTSPRGLKGMFTQLNAGQRI